jgi:hypothetical protein
MVYFTDEIIKSITLNESQSALTIVTNVTTYTLNGNSGYRNRCYLETDMNEINKLIGETIVDWDETYVEQGCDNIYFYDFNTINHHVQIRFCGEDDTYYGARVEIYRLPSEKDLYDKIVKFEDEIEKVKQEINERFGEVILNEHSRKI